MKNKNGAISVYALLACLFFLVFIVAAYRTVAVKVRTQTETTSVLLDMYKTDVSTSAIYNSIVMDDDVEINAKTEDELNIINDEEMHGNYIAIDGKIYSI